MPEEIEIENATTDKDLMAHPDVKDALLKVLERKLQEPSPPEIQEGWEKVRKGTKCVYPGCPEKASTAAFHGWPLCETHFDLTQWISFLIFKKVHDIDNPDTLAAKFEELKLSLRTFKG